MKNIALLLLLMLLCDGCRRSLIEEEIEVNYAEIAIDIDWQKSGLNPDDATLLIYRKGEPKPVTHIMLSSHEILKMKLGRYSFILFNQKIGDFDAIDFRNIDSYTGIEAFAKPMSNKQSGKYRGATRSPLVENPDLFFAVASLDDFEVTADMVNQTKLAVAESRNPGSRAPVHSLRFEPKLCATYVNVVVHTHGLNNVRKETVSGVIEGFAEAIHLYSQQPNTTPVSQLFEFESIVFDEGSTTDGSMNGFVSAFGQRDFKTGTAPVILTVEATLKDSDKTPFKFESDVTELISTDPEIEIKLNVEVTIDVPDVVPEGGGFDPTIPDWGDDVIIEK